MGLRSKSLFKSQKSHFIPRTVRIRKWNKDVKLTQKGRGPIVLVRLDDVVYSQALSHHCHDVGCFCLLPFGPEPVRPSLGNLETSESSEDTILTPRLAWTLGQHRQATPRTPNLKPSTNPGSLATELQAPATMPSRNFLYKTGSFLFIFQHIPVEGNCLSQ